MRFQLIEKNRHSTVSLWRGIWLAALMGALLSMIDSLAYFAAVLPGVVLVIAAGFLPHKWQKLVGSIGFAACAIWLALRLMPIGDGLGFLTNRLFTLSEENQDFYYTHFNVTGNAAAESLIFVTCALGALCVLLGSGVNLALTLLLAVLIAYFGVSPDIVWVCILITVAFSNALPKQGRWLPAILIAIFVAATAISLQTIAPEPDARMSNIADDLWDMLVPPEPPQEQTMPTEVPDIEELPDMEELPDLEDLATMETVPGIQIPPQIQENLQATAGLRIPQMQQTPQPVKPGPASTEKQSKPLPIKEIALAILGVLGVSGIWLFCVAKKRKRNRADMYVRDHAAAIRGMFLYAKRWRKWNACPKDIPPEVEAIWLEAAYSDHEMTDAQRETMLSFVRYSAADAWNTLSWWKRLTVYFYYAL